jgi:lipoprotein LpqB-like beta-propeller protein
MRRRALALTAVAVLLLGGCGIPDSTDVKVLGDGQSAGPAQDIDSPPPRAVTRSDTLDTATFISNYLKAAAGDPEGAVQRVKEFMDPDFAATFKPSTSDITVVRPTEQPLINSGSPYVTLKVEQIGTLKDDGQLVPLDHPSPQTLHFTFKLADKGLYLTKTDPSMVLSDVALQQYYQQHTIYFWNSDDTGLVPDVRYMPLSVPSVQQPTVILKWLARGPADWLSSVALGLPQDTSVPDNIPAISNDELQIKLNTTTSTPWDKAALDRLAQQLQWSLRPLTPRTLELTVGHQNPVQFSGEQNTPDANAASRQVDDPDRFVVYNGVIRRLSESAHAVNSVPVLKPAANKGVQSAAMRSQGGQTLAAVVSAAGKDRAPTLRVASAPTGKEADLRAVGGLGGALGPPSWVNTGSSDTDGAVGLITASSHLFSFAADGSGAQPVEWQQGGGPGAINSFSVAPDGHRIALVSGGRLYRAVLTAGSDGVVMSSPAQIDTPGLQSITAVAWSSEGWLVVAGVNKNHRVSIYDVSIDGSQSAIRLDDIGDEPITYLTAYPINPLTHSQLSDAKVAYVIHGDAGIAAGYPVPIKTSDLAGPANSPSSAGGILTSPFFLD